MAVVATLSEGYDLDYMWRQTGPGSQKEGAGYYLQASQDGSEPQGRWWGPGAEALGFQRGQVVERGPYDLLFGERYAPDGTPLGRAPGAGRKAADIYAQLLAAEPHATAERRHELRIEAAQQARQSPLYFDLTVSLSKSISIFHASLGENARQAQTATCRRRPGGLQPGHRHHPAAAVHPVPHLGALLCHRIPRGRPFHGAPGAAEPARHCRLRPLRLRQVRQGRTHRPDDLLHTLRADQHRHPRDLRRVRQLHRRLAACPQRRQAAGDHRRAHAQRVSDLITEPGHQASRDNLHPANSLAHRQQIGDFERDGPVPDAGPATGLSEPHSRPGPSEAAERSGGWQAEAG
jgi:hypothetical protein